MSTLATSEARWDERVARARQLAEQHPAAAGMLEFYAALAEQQKSLINGWTGETRGALRPGLLLESLDCERLLGALRDLVSWLLPVAPARLSEAARAMLEITEVEWPRLLEAYSTRTPDPAGQLDETTIFVLEAVLQPVAERAALSRREAVHDAPPPQRVFGEQRCPVCGGLPILGVLREEGHGSKRALLCGLCLTEWDYLRLVCAACGEQKFESLPVFTAEQFPHVRIEACDSCHTYLKTIDLTKDGLAVPAVDDIATASLDLWARDLGYARVRPSLLRT